MFAIGMIKLFKESENVFQKLLWSQVDFKIAVCIKVNKKCRTVPLSSITFNTSYWYFAAYLNKLFKMVYFPFQGFTLLFNIV